MAILADILRAIAIATGSTAAVVAAGLVITAVKDAGPFITGLSAGAISASAAGVGATAQASVLAGLHAADTGAVDAGMLFGAGAVRKTG